MALKQFITRVAGVDLQRSARYAVRILNVPVGRDANVEMMAESVSFPGQNMRASTDLLRYGPQREVAHAMTYGPFNMTFICTTGMPEKKFFENWQDYIVNKETWGPRYYNTYISEKMTLVALDKKGSDVYTCTIYEAYPKNINSQEFSYSNAGNYATVSVEFAFRWWESNNEIPQSNSAPNIPKRQVEVGLGETGSEYSGAKTVAEREQEGENWVAGMVKTADGNWVRKNN